MRYGAPRVGVTTPPSAEPVTLAEVKAFLRLDDSTQDQYIQSTLIPAARDMAERFTGRCIPATTYTMFLDYWPIKPLDWWDGVREGARVADRLGYVEVPRSPLVGITSVTVYDDTDTGVGMPDTSYYVSSADPDHFGRIALRIGAVWPVALRTRDAIKIIFTAGYASPPAALKQGILALVAFMFENRGDADMVAASGAEKYLLPFKMRYL